MDVVIVLPDGVTVFEALGPYGVFNRLSDTTVSLIGARAGRVPGHGSSIPLLAEAGFQDVEPRGVADVLVVPGGLGIRQLASDRAMIDWLAAAHTTAAWAIGVSTGSVLLSAAGVLHDRRATTHWLATDLLADEGAVPVDERVVRSDRVVTATGAVSGLEAALYVAGQERGTAAADRIRDDLDGELTGRLSDNKPVAVDAVVELTGVDPTSDRGPLAGLGGRRVAGPGRRPRRSGRMQVRGRRDDAAV